MYAPYHTPRVHDSYISFCHGPINAHLAGVWYAFNDVDNMSSNVPRCFCLCANDIIECSCQSLLQMQESVQASQEQEEAF